MQETNPAGRPPRNLRKLTNADSRFIENLTLGTASRGLNYHEELEDAKELLTDDCRFLSNLVSDLNAMEPILEEYYEVAVDLFQVGDMHNHSEEGSTYKLLDKDISELYCLQGEFECVGDSLDVTIDRLEAFEASIKEAKKVLKQATNKAWKAANLLDRRFAPLYDELNLTD